MLKEKSQKDFFSQKARQENYPARSVYKLIEADKKYGLIKKGDRVLDLGCSPGSWLLYISKKVGPKGRVLGIDVCDIKIPILENAKFLKKDALAMTDGDLIGLGGKFQLVVSDMAPKTSGIKSVDAGRSLELCEKALEIADKFLSPAGNFFCKLFESSETGDFFKKVESKFEFARRFKPKPSRSESKEIFIVAKGFKKLDKQSFVH